LRELLHATEKNVLKCFNTALFGEFHKRNREQCNEMGLFRELAIKDRLGSFA